MHYTALSADTRSTPFGSHWLPATMVHPMMYHSSLFVCVASFETLAQRPLSAESYEHRGKAIRLINTSLDNPGLLQSDEIIAAILSLANFEVKTLKSSSYMSINFNWPKCIVGDIPALDHHLDGIFNIARLRGAVDDFGMNGSLMKLTWLYVTATEINLSCSILSLIIDFRGFSILVLPIAAALLFLPMTPMP